MPKTVFLDIDINHSREAYARAAAFVEATDLRYNFSSKNIAELGGRELQSVIDMYALDFDWSSKGNILIHPQPACRLVIELFDQFSPLACENFEAFCTGSHGKSKVSGLSLHYKNVKFHRVVPGFIAQGGDFVMQNGAGGESIWGKKFKDDKG
ncbi:PCKR1, partial [Symbiodinium microadriaticum]